MLNDGEKGAIIQRDKQSYAVAPHIPCGVVTPVPPENSVLLDSAAVTIARSTPLP